MTNEEQFREIEKYINGKLDILIADFYAYFNHGIPFKKSWPIMENGAEKRINDYIDVCKEIGKIEKRTNGNKERLCSIAILLAQLYAMNGFIKAFIRKNRDNDDSKILFSNAMQWVKKAKETKHRYEKLFLLTAILANEAGDKIQALLALQNIKSDSVNYRNKIFFINEIMFHLCDNDKDEFRKMMYDPHANNIYGLSNRDTGFYQSLTHNYFSLREEDRTSEERQSILNKIENYAADKGFTAENAHDHICRNLYVSKNPRYKTLRAERFLFWSLYAEETIPLFLERSQGE